MRNKEIITSQSRQYQINSLLFKAVFTNNYNTSSEYFNDFMDYHQRFISGLDLQHISNLIYPLIFYKGHNKSEMCFNFFSKLSKNMQNEVIFSLSDKNSTLVDLSLYIMRDEQYCYDFFKIAKENLESENDILKQNTILKLLFDNNLTFPLLKGYFKENPHSPYNKMLDFIYKIEGDDENPQMEMGENSRIKLFFRCIESSDNMNKDSLKNILNLLYENNIQFICEPDKFDKIKDKIFAQIVNSNNTNLFSQLKENKKITVHPSFWSDRDISSKVNLIDFININKEPVIIHDIRSCLFSCAMTFDKETLHKLHNSPYVTPKSDLLTKMLHNTSEFIDDNSNITDIKMNFIKELFDICANEKDFDISKKIMRMPLCKSFKDILHTLNERYIINNQINPVDNITLNNKVSKRL